MVLPITLKRSPGRQARMARSSASSVAATSSRPGLSVLGRRKVADVSPWKPSRYIVRSRLMMSSGSSARLSSALIA